MCGFRRGYIMHDETTDYSARNNGQFIYPHCLPPSSYSTRSFLAQTDVCYKQLCPCKMNQLCACISVHSLQTCKLSFWKHALPFFCPKCFTFLSIWTVSALPVVFFFIGNMSCNIRVFAFDSLL